MTALNVTGDLSTLGLYGLEADSDDCPKCTRPMPYGAQQCDDCADTPAVTA